jgi:hypothetical protein
MGTELLAAVGMVFALFLIVATAAEQVLEGSRGLLERFGVTLLKSGVSMDDAMKLAGEFLPQDTKDPVAQAALVKVHALQAVAKDYPRKLSEKLGKIDEVETQLKTAFAGIDGLTTLKEEAISGLNAVSAEVAKLAGETERARIWTLRIFCGLISFVLCRFVGFDALSIAASSFPDQLPMLASNYAEAGATGAWTWWGMLATAFAASAGSSYWHDQLDRVRALKGVTASLKGG